MRTAEELRRAKLIRTLPEPTNQIHARARASLYDKIMRLEFAERFVSLNETHQDIILEKSPHDFEGLSNTLQCIEMMLQEARILGYHAQKLENDSGIRILNPIPPS